MIAAQQTYLPGMAPADPLAAARARLAALDEQWERLKGNRDDPERSRVQIARRAALVEVDALTNGPAWWHKA